MKLKKKLPQGAAATVEQTGNGISRRAFLRTSGIAAGGTALGSMLTPGMMKKAQAASTAGGKAEIIRSVCTHCSVGCGIYAEVENGVWTGQEPAFDHPLIWVHIAPRVPRCESMAMVNAA